MFRIFSARNNPNTKTNDYVFYEKGIIDVTNFDVMSPDDDLGYMCGCDIFVFQNGIIEIFSDDNEKELLERFSVSDVVRASNNINNYDPDYAMDVSMITKKKELRISFQSKESKNRFWNVITTIYDKI